MELIRRTSSTLISNVFVLRQSGAAACRPSSRMTVSLNKAFVIHRAVDRNELAHGQRMRKSARRLRVFELDREHVRIDLRFRVVLWDFSVNAYSDPSMKRLIGVSVDVPGSRLGKETAAISRGDGARLLEIILRRLRSARRLSSLRSFAVGRSVSTGK